MNGPFGGDVRELDPGHSVHVDYPLTPGYPKGIAAYKDARCHALPPGAHRPV